MAKGFRFAADSRDRWDRQVGEPAEEYDWFVQYRNDGARRSHARVADRFRIPRTRVDRVAKQNKWAERYGAFKAHNSAELRERYRDLLEQTAVPFVQGLLKLSARVAVADVSKLPVDRAFAALTNGLRLATTPGLADLINDDVAEGDSRELEALDLVLNELAEKWPDAHDAVLDRLDVAVHGGPLPEDDGDAAGPGDAGDAEGGT
jgi:hypothetical protein